MTKPINKTHIAIKNAALNGLSQEQAANAEILVQEHSKRTGIPSYHIHRGDFLTPQQCKLVRNVWDTLPGSSCWNSAWHCILKQQDWFGVDVQD